MVYLVPLVDPDGADLVAGPSRRAAQNIALPRRSRRRFPDVPFPSGWKANLSGVDLNLNYPARWGRRLAGSRPQRALPALHPRLSAITAGSAGDSRSRRLHGLHPPGSHAGAAHAGARDLSRPEEDAPEGSEPLAQALAAASGYGLRTSRRSRPTRASRTGSCSGSTVRRSPWKCGLGENPLPPSALDGLCARSSSHCSSQRTVVEGWFSSRVRRFKPPPGLVF